MYDPTLCGRYMNVYRSLNSERAPRVCASGVLLSLLSLWRRLGLVLWPFGSKTDITVAFLGYTVTVSLSAYIYEFI